MNLQPVSLRVLMSADTVGGVWMYAIELARDLRRFGVQVILATMGRPLSPDQRTQARAVPDLVLCESAYRLEWMDEPWDDVTRAGEWLLALRDRYCPHLVHLNHYSHGHLDWGVPVVVVAHSCVLSWFDAVRGESAPPAWDRYRAAVTAGLQTADCVVAPSEAMLASVSAHYGPLTGAHQVIYNGRSATAYRPGRKADFVLAAGRLWDTAKNLAALTRVAPVLELPVYIAGDAQHPDGGTASLAHVQLLGQVSPDALRQWYARAPIYALPARYEPFGLSVLEAALAGCAPVIGDIPSLRELWHGAACLVPPDDERALAATINALAADSRQRNAIANAARARARRYSTERMTAAYLALYGAMLPRRNARVLPLLAGSG